LRTREFLLELHAADLLVAILRARVTSHAGDGCGAQSKNRHAAVAADAACRQGGRRLVIGAQVLAFPNESGPEKALTVRALGLGHYARPSLGVNAA
jgi:hypothetical protein